MNVANSRYGKQRVDKEGRVLQGAQPDLDKEGEGEVLQDDQGEAATLRPARVPRASQEDPSRLITRDFWEFSSSCW